MGDIQVNIRKAQDKLREVGEDILEFTEKAQRADASGDKGNAALYREAAEKLKRQRTALQAQLSDLQRRAQGK